MESAGDSDSPDFFGGGVGLGNIAADEGAAAEDGGTDAFLGGGFGFGSAEPPTDLGGGNRLEGAMEPRPPRIVSGAAGTDSGA